MLDRLKAEIHVLCISQTIFFSRERVLTRQNLKTNEWKFKNLTAGRLGQLHLSPYYLTLCLINC